MVEAALAGFIENPICLYSNKQFDGLRQNGVARGSVLTALICSATGRPEQSGRPDLLFEDFEKEKYDNWTARGEAFGAGPVARTEIPVYQGNVGGKGKRVVNSHASAPGDSVGSKDARIGKLISKSFTINRKFINLYVGGGSHKNRTCVNVVVEGTLVGSVTELNDNRMQQQSFSVEAYEGK